MRTLGLHEIFKFAHLKFTVYGRGQTDIHTTSANAVTLVWGSLRLVPINAGCIVALVIKLLCSNVLDAANIKDSTAISYEYW